VCVCACGMTGGWHACVCARAHACVRVRAWPGTLHWRLTDRQTDRRQRAMGQTDRQEDRQADRQADRQTDRQPGTHTDTQTQTQTQTHTHTHTHTHAHRSRRISTPQFARYVQKLFFWYRGWGLLLTCVLCLNLSAMCNPGQLTKSWTLSS
jgi:hypothetical protein